MSEYLFDYLLYNKQNYAKSMMAPEWIFCQAPENM